MKAEKTFNIVEGIDGVVREVPSWEMVVLRDRVVHEKTIQDGKTFKFFYRQVK